MEEFINSRIELLKDKHVFLDLDGTLFEYRFNNHVSGDTNLGGF